MISWVLTYERWIKIMKTDFNAFKNSAPNLLDRRVNAQPKILLQQSKTISILNRATFHLCQSNPQITPDPRSSAFQDDDVYNRLDLKDYNALRKEERLDTPIPSSVGRHEREFLDKMKSGVSSFFPNISVLGRNDLPCGATSAESSQELPLVRQNFSRDDMRHSYPLGDNVALLHDVGNSDPFPETSTNEKSALLDLENSKFSKEDADRLKSAHGVFLGSPTHEEANAENEPPNDIAKSVSNITEKEVLTPVAETAREIQLSCEKEIGSLLSRLNGTQRFILSAFKKNKTLKKSRIISFLLVHGKLKKLAKLGDLQTMAKDIQNFESGYPEKEVNVSGFFVKAKKFGLC